MTIQTPVKHGLMIGGKLIADTAKLQRDLVDLAGEAHRDVIFGRLVGEIITATMAQTEPVEFKTLQDMWDNTLFRLGAVASMTALTTGAYDCDYYDPELGPEPRLGTTDDARVSKYWDFITPGGADAEWRQATGSDSLEAIRPVEGHTLPFRGECAGAFQLTVFWGLLNGLGGEAFRQLSSQFGTMLVGPWTDNPCRQFMSDKVSLLDPPIPGDYMYFKNKDDYPQLAPDGFWQGLNAMYMGADMLGTRHYSGMGAAWMSEQNLRASLVNAYYHDCYPHTIDHPLVDVRFSQRRLLQIPDTFTEAPMTLRPATPSKGKVPTTAGLTAVGYQAFDHQTFRNARTTVREVTELFAIDALELHQQPGAGIDNPAMRFKAPGAIVVLDYHDAEAGRRDPEAVVRAVVRLTTG